MNFGKINIMSIIDDDELYEMLRGAVLRERERCARVVERTTAIVAACIRNGFDPDKVDDDAEMQQELTPDQKRVWPLI